MSGHNYGKYTVTANSTRVAIKENSNGMFWEVITRFLKNAPDIELLKFKDERELESLLRNSDAIVLVLEQADTSNVQDYRQYYNLHRNIAIIIIDPSGEESIVRTSDLGCDLLLRLVRTLSIERPKADSACSPRLRLVSSSENSAEKGKPAVIEPYNDMHEHLDDVRIWLDLCIHERLSAEAESGTDSSIPGWAMSAKRARSLLGDAGSNNNNESLREARAHIEVIMAKRMDISRNEGLISKLVIVSQVFKLNELEWKILMIVLAAELDDRYARIFGFLNDDLSRRRPTASILRQLLLSDNQLAWDVREILEGDGPLARYQLVMTDGNDSVAGSEAGLMIAPDLVSYLVKDTVEYSTNYAISLLLSQHQQVIYDIYDTETKALKEKLKLWREYSSQDNRRPVILLVGERDTLKWFTSTSCNEHNNVVVLNALLLSDQGVEQLQDSIFAVARLAKLHDAIVVITGLHLLQPAFRASIETILLETIYPLVFRIVIHGDNQWTIPAGVPAWRIERVTPSAQTRAKYWLKHARLANINLTESDADTLAAVVRFDEADIESVVQICDSTANGKNAFESLKEAARKVASSAIPRMARCINSECTWDDIILPEHVLSSLKQIPSHIHCAAQVMENWGYASRMPYGRGITALFSGSSGTGKTMAAQIIARDLGVALYQVDLSKTISKYIGETEKNLDVIFDAAERSSAVLLFDEADALFGKRTEVKDAHDRYANVEVAYLLQRMETYSGLAILTSNLKQNMDHGFLRRLRFVIDFPAPDAKHREQIWKRVFPANVPFDDDINVKFLAHKLKLTGGHIQQISVRAAFAGAADGGVVTMRHIIQATREELTKVGMLNAEHNLTELLTNNAYGASM